MPQPGKLRRQVAGAYRQSKRSSVVVYVVLRVLVILCMVRQFTVGSYHYVLLCALSLLLMTIPLILKSTLRICMPNALEIAVVGFVFAAEILGEIGNFYGALPFWDTMLHTMNGFLAAAVGFGLIDLMNTHSKRMQMSPFFVALVAFCFSMTTGAVWEIIEYSIDRGFGTDMQKDSVVQQISSIQLNPAGDNDPIVIDGVAYTVLYDESGAALWQVEGGYLDVGLNDTMEDLIVNFAGAAVFSVLGGLYVYRRDKYGFAGGFIITRDGEPGAGPYIRDGERSLQE